ncbi:MAG: hypothetical protein AABY58_05875, partial [Nitrospirota bacterium]
SSRDKSPASSLFTISSSLLTASSNLISFKKISVFSYFTLTKRACGVKRYKDMELYQYGLFHDVGKLLILSVDIAKNA